MATGDQLNFSLGVEYTGAQALNQFGKDVEQAGTKTQQYAKIAQQAANAEKELEKNAAAAGKTASAASILGQTTSKLTRFGGGILGGVGLGQLGGLFSAFGSAYGMGALIGQGISSAVKYQDALVGVSLASERMAHSSGRMYQEVIKVGQGLRLTGTETAGLYLQAERFKVDKVEDFVIATQKMSDTLGISVESAGEFNYQLQRLPGMTGPLLGMGSVLKGLTDNFNVSGERLVNSMKDQSTLMVSVLPQAREKASKEFAASEALFSHMNIGEGKLYEMLYKFTQYKFDPIQTLAGRAGFSVDAVRQMLSRGEVSKAVEVMLRGIQQAVKSGSFAGRMDVFAQMLGLDEGTLSKIALAVERGDVSRLMQTAFKNSEKGIDSIEERWMDMMESVSNKMELLGTTLSNLDLSMMQQPVNLLSSSVDKLNSVTSQWLSGLQLAQQTGAQSGWSSLSTEAQAALVGAGVFATGAMIAMIGAGPAGWILGVAVAAALAVPAISKLIDLGKLVPSSFPGRDFFGSPTNNFQMPTEEERRALRIGFLAKTFGPEPLNPNAPGSPDDALMSSTLMDAFADLDRVFLGIDQARAERSPTVRGLKTVDSALTSITPYLSAPMNEAVKMLTRLVQLVETSDTAVKIGDHLHALGSRLIQETNKSLALRPGNISHEFSPPPSLDESVKSFQR